MEVEELFQERMEGKEKYQIKALHDGPAIYVPASEDHSEATRRVGRNGDPHCPLHWLR